MCWSKRFVPVFLGFWGLLISVGYRSVFSIVMVHIVKSENHSENMDPTYTEFYCTVNDSINVPADWTASSTQYLHAGFYAGSFSTQLLGGYLVTRYSSKMVCGVTILISSVLLLFIPAAISVNYVLLFFIRFVQGTVEGISQAALIAVISAWTPKSEKSRMCSFLYSGAYISPAVALAVTGIIACTFSWDASLYIYGSCGVIWSCIWLTCVYDTPSQHSGLSKDEKLLFDREGSGVQQGSYNIADKVPWRKIISSLPVWAVFVGCFCRNWIFSLLMLGIPQYFKVAFTTNIAEIGIESALPELLLATTSVLGGVLIDRLIKSHLVSTTVGRKIAHCVGFGVEALCILSLRFIDRREVALIVLCVGVAVSGLSVSGYEANPLDLSPQYAGILLALARHGTLGAVINTAVSGSLVPENIKAWQNIFTISGSVHIAGAIFYGIFASGELQNWYLEDPETKSLVNDATIQQEDSI